MDIISTGRLLDYSEFNLYSDTFIETGSGHGAGIQRALDANFERVHSIEAHEDSFHICVRRFVNNPRVRLYHGRSEAVLPHVLDKLTDDRLVIFLDAHASGEKSFGHVEWEQGKQEFFQDTIIRKELGAILKDAGRHVIILDDINGTADGLAVQYAEMIDNALADYRFFFFDEHIGAFYPDKLLVCLPGELA